MRAPTRVLRGPRLLHVPNSCPNLRVPGFLSPHPPLRDSSRSFDPRFLPSKLVLDPVSQTQTSSTLKSLGYSNHPGVFARTLLRLEASSTFGTREFSNP